MTYCLSCNTFHIAGCPNQGAIPVPNPYTQIDPNPRTEREIEAGKKLGKAIGRLVR